MMRYLLILVLALGLAACNKEADKAADKPAAKPAPEKKAAPTGPTHSKTYTVKDEFNYVRDAVKQAINDRGMVITAVSHISNMLQRTAKDIGASKKIYVKAEALLFCSASLSRNMMESDPHNAVFCPYNITIYELADKPGTIYVAYRRPQLVGSDASKKSLQAIDKLLDSIIREALEIE